MPRQHRQRLSAGRCSRNPGWSAHSTSPNTIGCRDTAVSTCRAWTVRRYSLPVTASWCSPVKWPVSRWYRSTTRAGCGPPTNRCGPPSRSGGGYRGARWWAGCNPATRAAPPSVCTGGYAGAGSISTHSACCGTHRFASNPSTPSRRRAPTVTRRGGCGTVSAPRRCRLPRAPSAHASNPGSPPRSGRGANTRRWMRARPGRPARYGYTAADRA